MKLFDYFKINLITDYALTVIAGHLLQHLERFELCDTTLLFMLQELNNVEPSVKHIPRVPSHNLPLPGCFGEDATRAKNSVKTPRMLELLRGTSRIF